MESVLAGISLLEGTVILRHGVRGYVSCANRSLGCANLSKSTCVQFTARPEDICGTALKRSDKVEPGERISRRRCFCNSPSIVGLSESGRAYIGCESRGCKFFRWADSVLDPPYYSLAHSRTVWQPIGPPVFKLLPSDVSRLPEYVVQGALGDCWFLSCVAVVCESRDLLSRVIGEALDGHQCFHFCYNGEWCVIQVDYLVPFLTSGQKAGKAAFAQPKDNVVIGPLIEKAYAQMYGCYAAISGGFVSEALFELTGCPTECISLGSETKNDRDLLWGKLCSWKDSGFLIGCSTSVTGSDEEGDSQGLVSMHAYSVLDAVELRDVAVGRQTKISDFVSGKALAAEKLETLRLVQVRNPWGKKEWTGDWGGKSNKWTRSVVEQLPWYAERDQRGTFWMEFSDWMSMFSEVEVAKTHRDWWTLAFRLEAHDAWVVPLENLLGRTKSTVPNTCFEIISVESNWCYITLVHPSLRGKPDSWFFPDIHWFVRESTTGKIIASAVGHVQRVHTIEVVLSADVKYEILFFALSHDFILPPGESPVVRIFSAQPVTLNEKRGTFSVPIQAFERMLVTETPFMEQIILTPSLIVSRHSTPCLSVFALTKTNQCSDDGLEIRINLTMHDSELRAIGRWTFSTENIDPNHSGTTILGIITRRRHGRFHTGEELEKYKFDIDVIPSILCENRVKKSRLQVHDIIELD